MKHACRYLAAAFALGIAASRPAAAEIFYSDTYLSVRNLWGDTQPGYGGTTSFTAGNIAYANGWTYGSNFVSLDLEDIGHQDGANCVFSCAKATSNSFELYAVFRTVLSGNKITGSKMFSFGPIADIGLEIGGDIDTQNDQFASYKRLIVVGPQFSIAVPKGFWTISAHLSHEWNTDAYAANNSTNFDVTPEFETAWLFPFNVGPVPLKFTGFANVILPKGRGEPSLPETGTEVLLHPKLMVDVGALLGGKPNTFDAGVGYEYWYNKFGNQAKYLPGTEQHAFFVEAGYHF